MVWHGSLGWHNFRMTGFFGRGIWIGVNEALGWLAILLIWSLLMIGIILFALPAKSRAALAVRIIVAVFLAATAEELLYWHLIVFPVLDLLRSRFGFDWFSLLQVLTIGVIVTLVARRSRRTAHA